jgi:hypothetical protein
MGSRQNSFKEESEFTILTMLLDAVVSVIKDYLTNLQFFSHLLVSGDFAHSLCSSPIETLKVRQCSSWKLTQFTMLNKVQDPLACNINPSLLRALVLLLFIEWGDSAQKWCCSSRKAVFLLSSNWVHNTNHVARPSCSYIKNYLTNLQVFSHLLVCGDFAQSWCPSPMKMLTVRHRSF